MSTSLIINCTCGKVRLEVQGHPIASVECCCTSCRSTAEKIQGLSGAPKILTSYGATPFVMYRKDRVRFLTGFENLRELRMTPEAKTRRVVATCCNSPVFLEFSHGHWLSIYAGLWPDDVRPALQMRTMVSDLEKGAILPNDVPNAKSQSFGFFTKLLRAWIGMGFRVPAVPATPPYDI